MDQTHFEDAEALGRGSGVAWIDDQPLHRLAAAVTFAALLLFATLGAGTLAQVAGSVDDRPLPAPEAAPAPISLSLNG